MLHLPNSARDNDKTGRYFAHISRIADCCSTVKVESINSLDSGAIISARAAAISIGVLGVAATAHRFGMSGKGKRCFGSVALTQLRSSCRRRQMRVWGNPGSTRDLKQLFFLPCVAWRTRQVRARFDGEPSDGNDRRASMQRKVLWEQTESRQ